MTDTTGNRPEDTGKTAASSGSSLSQQVIAIATTAPSMALAAVVLALTSLLTMATAADIGQLDSSDPGIGVALPGRHAGQITSGVRALVALLALVLAVAAVKKLGTATVRRTDVESPGWITMVVGAAALIAVVAVVLNVVGFLASFNVGGSPFGVYNHIGS